VRRYVTLRHGSTSHVTSLSGDQLGIRILERSGEGRELEIERNSRFSDPLVLSQRRLNLNIEYQLRMSIISIYSTEVIWSVKLCSWWRSTLYEQQCLPVRLLKLGVDRLRPLLKLAGTLFGRSRFQHHRWIGGRSFGRFVDTSEEGVDRWFVEVTAYQISHLWLITVTLCLLTWLHFPYYYY
jgi:hypothetical protein